jgi:hypothetical protein
MPGSEGQSGTAGQGSPPRRAWLLLALGGVIFMGYFPDRPDLTALLRLAPRLPFLFLDIAAPAIPFLLGLLVMWWRLPRWLLWIGVSIAASWIAVTVVIAALSGPGAPFVLVKGGGLAAAMIAGLGIATRTRRPRWGVGYSEVVLGAATAIGIWSLLQVAVVLARSQQLAAGSPYCVATAKRPADGVAYGAVETLAELRGLSLFTTHTGYKSPSGFYFHALLAIARDTGTAYFNWSPQGQAFHPLPYPDRFVVRVEAACVPDVAFGAGLKLY